MHWLARTAMSMATALLPMGGEALASSAASPPAAAGPTTVVADTTDTAPGSVFAGRAGGAGGAFVLLGAVGRRAVAPPGARAYTGGIRLNVRTGPSRAHRLVTTLRDGTRLRVTCQVTGQLVSGHARRTARWDRLVGGRYVSDANVAWRPARPRLPRCGARHSPARPTRIAVADTGGISLNVRAGPSRAHRLVTTLRDGTRLRVTCQVTGQLVSGHARRTARWDRLVGGRYVSDANVTWRPARPALPACRIAPAAVPVTPAAFIRAIAGPARQSMRRYRVPASVTIAQAILESGWGRSELSTAHRNYFGIKCFGTPGPIAVGCASYPTTECERSHCWRTEATFRAYRSLRDSVRDHGRFLVVNPRYRPAFAHSRRADRFAVAIHRAGYATAPGYARSIITLMRQYRLYRYDR